MNFLADFHIHSKYSIATAKNLDLENIYIWAQKKGITVVATGDFTHPAWIQEISEKLIPAEDGLFRLRDEISKPCDTFIPHSCRGIVRFLLVTEISNIYKKNGKTRKNHNLIFMPDLPSARRFNNRLDKIGNIRSDGRPILGLDTRNLLEILLEVNKSSFLVPAHIWTPWFSLFGSKSGFDSIEECFEDLTSQIFAVETGLSSDPPMNHRISGLDKLTLISNSDAHSPQNIGREATIFNTELDYFHIKKAIKTGDPDIFKGTIEFFPEEGKYHADGHRNCAVQMMPQETAACDGICPVCGKEITRGVLYRVEELADRPTGFLSKNQRPFSSIVPLPTLLSELFRKGVGTKKTMSCYEDVIATFGPELWVLRKCPIKQLKGFGHRLLSEAIDRVRNRNIILTPGYDGEYGKISIFSETEREILLGQQYLFDQTEELKFGLQKTISEPGKTFTPKAKVEKIGETTGIAKIENKSKGLLKDLNRDQRQAVTSSSRYLLIQAGPGTGKTRTLTYRIAHLINEQKETPTAILALTFTNKAAAEMKARIGDLIPKSSAKPFIGTFHSFCIRLIQQQPLYKDWTIADDATRLDIMEDAIQMIQTSGINTAMKAADILRCVEKAKQNLKAPEGINGLFPDNEIQEISFIYKKYQDILSIQHLMDYDDIIIQSLLLLGNKNIPAPLNTHPVRHIFIDEYQDLNYGQYQLLKGLQNGAVSPVSVCAIGDPDQSIYGFRGSDASYFNRFCEDFPDTENISLNRNYRSAETILKVSSQMIRKRRTGMGTTMYSGIEGVAQVTVLQVVSEKAEAVAVGKTITSMIGGTGFQFYDFQESPEYADFETANLSFSDFAVLFRTRRQGDILFKMLMAAGIPCQVVSKKSILSTRGISELFSLLKVVNGFGSYGDFARVGGIVDPGIDPQSISHLKNWGYGKRLPLQIALKNAERFPVIGMSAIKQMALCDVRRTIERLNKKTEGMTVTEQIVFLVENTRVGTIIQAKKNRKDMLEQVVELSRYSDYGLYEFMEILSMGKDQDTYREKAEKVSLMTMHASKGLEFPIVFICGCEDGIIPFRQEKWQPGKRLSTVDMAEERRLFYVAMTRAKDNLFLLHARKRFVYGQAADNPICPFIGDIEKSFLLMKKGEMGSGTKKTQIQLALF